jgi:uncharacterized protein YoxC
MAEVAVILVALAVIAVAVVLVSTLLAIKRAALRAEMVLLLLEREIRPTTSQLHAVMEELRTFSHQAGRDIERVAATAQAVGRTTETIGRLVGLVGTMGRMGQIVGAASGVKKGLDVFIAKLLSRNRGH